jgi:hypothetical protein
MRATLIRSITFAESMSLFPRIFDSLTRVFIIRQKVMKSSQFVKVHVNLFNIYSIIYLSKEA